VKVVKVLLSSCQDSLAGGRAPAVWQLTSKELSALRALRLVRILIQSGGTEGGRENVNH